MRSPKILPLRNINVIELPGLAPVPFCGQILADFGANVVLIEKKGSDFVQLLDRGKQKLIIDFKCATDFAKLKQLCLNADVLLDPFRSGVLEGMGLDPAQLLKTNPKLIVARLTGYGQTGPLSTKAGHDINFLSLSGLMPTICGEKLRPPSNILGDFAGGSLIAAFGIVSALYERTYNGNKGRILDCSMTEGVAYLGTFLTMYNNFPLLYGSEYSMSSGNCPIYRTYETKDKKFMAVGALEQKFHEKFFESNLFFVATIQTLHLNAEAATAQMFKDPEGISRTIENIFREKSQKEWIKIFDEVDACVTPVLDLNEVGTFPQHVKRKFFEKLRNDNEYECKYIPNPAPLFCDSTSSADPKEKSKI